MSDRMTDETFEAMLRSKGYGDLDASLALNVEARRARKAEDDLRAQLAAATAERDALKAETKRLTDAATEARQLLEYAESRWDRIRRDKGDDADRAELSSNLSYALGKLDTALAPKP